MGAQIFWAVYDTSADSDFYPFNTLPEAEAELERWLANGLVESLTDEGGKWCATWGRFYVCAAMANTVPDNDAPESDEWSLWNYGGEGYPVLTYRKYYASFGECDHYDINPERFTA